MRSGFVYATICVSLAAFTQVDAKTVTKFKTVTTTEYRDSTPTNTAAIDEMPAKDISPEFSNGGMSDMESLPPKATATGESKPAKSDIPAKPTSKAKPPATTAGAPPLQSSPVDAVASGSAKVLPPSSGAPAGTASAPMPSAGSNKSVSQIHKASSAAGHSNAKSSATASASGFNFTPITLAPESSLAHKPTSLREMTASKHGAAATMGAEHASSAGRSIFYGMSYATIAGITVLGMAASALVL